MILPHTSVMSSLITQNFPKVKYPEINTKTSSARVLTSLENRLKIEQKEKKKREEAQEKDRKKREREQKRLAVAEEKQRKASEREQKCCAREAQKQKSATSKKSSSLKGIIIVFVLWLKCRTDRKTDW